MHPGIRRSALEYALAVFAVAAAVLLRWLLQPLLGDTLPLVTLFAAVAAAAWFGGRGPALLGAVLGYVACAFFFIEPRHYLGLEEPRNLVGLAAYLISCLLIVGFLEAMRAAQRRAEEAAAAAAADRAWLRTTLASVGDGIVTTDAEGRVSFLNPVAESLTGWTQSEALGRPLEEVFVILNEYTRLPAETPVARVLREGLVLGLANHTVLVARDGTERAIDDSAAPIRGPDGAIAGVVLVFRDVTAKRRAEQAVRESESRKAAILEAALDCILTIDHEGRIVEFNPAAERVFGHRREQVLGRELAELIVPARLREQHRRGLANYLASGHGPVLHQRLEMPALRADGREFPAELAITPVKRDGPPLFTAYLRDISVQKRAELRRAARLEVTQVLAAADTVKEAAPGILRAVGESLGWDVGAVWLTEEQAGVLRCLEFWRRPEVCVPQFEAATRGRSFPPGVGLPGRIWTSGRPAWIPDVVHDDDFPRAAIASAEGLHGAFGFPLRIGPQFLGVIEFFSREIREPDPDLLEMMASIGSQVGQFLERRRAEESLRERERLYRTLTSHAPVGIFQTDADGNCLFVNPRWREMAGLSQEEARGQGWAAALHPEDRDRVYREWYDAARAGREFASEYRFRTPQGKITWLAGSAVTLRDDHGEIAGYIGTVADITPRVLAEEQLRAAQRQLQIVTDCMSAPVTRCSRDLRYRWVSRPYADWIGRPAEDIVGRTIAEVLGPAAFAQLRPHFERVLAGEQVRCEEEVDYLGQGRRWVNAVYTPTYDATGAVDGWVAVILDVEERRRAEERIRSVVNHVVDGIITIDEAGTVESLNPAGERLFGYRAEEVIGQNVKMLMPEPYRSEHDSYLASYLRTGQAKVIGIGREVVGRRKDGTAFPMELAVSEFRLGERRYFTGIVRDITERKRLEQQLRERAEQLAEADRRKDDFLATLAHELRNPLAPIRNALELLRRARRDEQILGEARGIMERQLAHLVRLVDDLLDVSRITRGKLQLRRERLDLADVLRGAVEAARPFLDASAHELTVALPPAPVYLDADPTRLTQVFANLLHNAAKYTEKGGHVWLTAERRGEEVVVCIRDTGIGITADDLASLFEPFSQVAPALERSQGGLGVGLSLVKGLVELHGGRVEARSGGRGKGSEFTVRLPIADDPVQLPQAAVEERQAPADGPRLRILVVDDNRDAADTLALILRLMGHQVEAAYDGLEGVQAAAASRPDVVVLDIGMPRLNGYEAARHIRAQPWGGRVVLVALTGWGQEEDRRRALEAGFDRHLTKPAEAAVLRDVLEEVAAAAGR